MDNNPYSSPSEAASIVPPDSGSEAIRKQYLSHEASVKSIGSLYMLGAIILVPIGLFLLFQGFAEQVTAQQLTLFGLGIVYVGLGVLQATTAIGLRRLQPWSRIVAAVLSVFGLLGFPIGTLISAYFLYLLLCKKGVYIFTDEYRRVVAETPHIKYRTSVILIILLLILVVLVFGGITALLFSG